MHGAHKKSTGQITDQTSIKLQAKWRNKRGSVVISLLFIFILYFHSVLFGLCVSPKIIQYRPPSLALLLFRPYIPFCLFALYCHAFFDRDSGGFIFSGSAEEGIRRWCSDCAVRHCLADNWGPWCGRTQKARSSSLLFVFP